MKKFVLGVVVLVGAVVIGMAACEVQAAELTQTEPDRGFNWQDRQYFGRAYTERQIGGGDSAASGESGDAGAGASSGGSGDSGGNGEGCSK